MGSNIEKGYKITEAEREVLRKNISEY